LTFLTYIEVIINKCWFSIPLELFEWKYVHWEKWESKTFHPTTLGYDICEYIFTFCNAHDYDVIWVMVMSRKYFCFWHFMTIHCTNCRNLSLSDALPSSLIDSNVSLKWKQWKSKELGTHSLIRSIVGVKGLDRGYNFAWDLISIGGLHVKLWAPKSCGNPNCGNFGLPLGSSRTKWHLGVDLVASHRVYYKGEGHGFPQVWAMVNLVSPCLPWFIRAPKCSNYALTNLLFGLCWYVWIIGACHSS